MQPRTSPGDNEIEEIRSCLSELSQKIAANFLKGYRENQIGNNPSGKKEIDDNDDQNEGLA